MGNIVRDYSYGGKFEFHQLNASLMWGFLYSSVVNIPAMFRSKTLSHIQSLKSALILKKVTQWGDLFNIVKKRQLMVFKINQLVALIKKLFIG